MNKENGQNKKEKYKATFDPFIVEIPRESPQERDKTLGSNPGVKTTKETSVLKKKKKSQAIRSLLFCFA